MNVTADIVGYCYYALCVYSHLFRNAGAVTIRVQRRFNELEFAIAETTATNEEESWTTAAWDSNMGHMFTPGRFKMGMYPLVKWLTAQVW